MTMNVHQRIAPYFLLTAIACGPKQMVNKGDVHLADNRPDAAAQYYQRALDKDPSHIAALRGLAASHLAKEQPIRAIIPAQRAVKAGDRAAVRLLSRALLTTGRAEEALKTVQKGLDERPDNPAYRRLKVEALIAIGEYDDAADTADETLLDISDIKARTLHTWALSRAGRIDSANAMAAETAAMAADNASAQALCAYVFWLAGRQADFDRAHKLARALLPASPAEAIRYAKWLAEEGNKEGAIRSLSGTRAAYPTSGKVAFQIGILYADRRAWGDAIRELSAALKLAPYADESTISGVQRMKTGDSLVESQRRLETELIAQRLGDSYSALGQHGNAAQAWTVAASSTTKPTAAAFLTVARAWKKAGNIDAMGRAAQQATGVDSSNPEAHHILAQAFDGAGNIEWAIRHARKSWELNPEQADVVIFLGGLYENRGEKRIARELYRDALRRHPSDARIYAAFERVGGTRRR
jgi:tetratricopeptide (TPR) repeat protein